MDKLEQMEIMSERIEENCDDYDTCDECPLCNEDFCYPYTDGEDYAGLVNNCKILNIDISDIVGDADEVEQPKKANPKAFTASDIEPGYLLQLKGRKFAIAMGEKRNLLFYYFDVDKSQLNGYAFSSSDIRDDFTVLCDIAIIAIYGHTFSTNLGLGERLILWERKGSEYKIYNIENVRQSIQISPNANTYLTGDAYGDILIENISDNEEYLRVKRENLPGLISALQEIQGLYEEAKE